MPLLTTPRNVSGPFAVDSATMSPDASSTPWGRPNNAPAQSKTSQYIDKITSENEKIKRELKSEKLAREEDIKRAAAANRKAEETRIELQSLQLIADTNARAIERKDRKLEELKAQLDAEVNRRKSAEQRAEEALKMLSDTRSETQRQLAAAYNQKHLAETNLLAARDGYKRTIDGLRDYVKRTNEELNELRAQRIEDAETIRRQNTIGEQLEFEMKRTFRAENTMTDMLGTYKEQHRKEVDALVAEAEKMRSSLPEKEEEVAKALEEVKQIGQKMKWVMAQQQRTANV